VVAMRTPLDRFKEAQAERASGFESALVEIQSGQKRGHWIWYVFPQLSGLGRSTMSRIYGIAGRQEAEAYLRDPLLRSRYLTVVTALAEQLSRGVSFDVLMNSSVDAMKVVSSLTLFGRVARRLHAVEAVAEYKSIADIADRLLQHADAEGYPPCRVTSDRLGDA
jgi:uncharacterized protein (DUF1810 family)